MLERVLLGGGFAFAAAIQPGPLQAFLLARTLSVGWRRALPAALAPVVSDGPIAALVLLVLGGVPGGAGRVLQGAGGLVLLWLGWRTWSRWTTRIDVTHVDDRPSAPRTLAEATFVNLLNPGPYVGWSLVLGPAFVRAWREQPVAAVALVASFYGVMVVTLAATVIAFGRLGAVAPQTRRRLGLASAVALAAVGAYQLISSALGS